ncbi:hypothetical protein MRX96_011464 [Rhipicephalus microplus]
MVTNSMSLALRVPTQRLVEGSSIAGLSLNGGSGVPVTSTVGSVGTAEAVAVEHQAADTSTPGVPPTRCPLCPPDCGGAGRAAACGLCGLAFAQRGALEAHLRACPGPPEGLRLLLGPPPPAPLQHHPPHHRCCCWHPTPTG